MRSLRDDVWAIGLSAAFYGSFAWDQFYPPLNSQSFTPAFAIALAVLAVLLCILHGRPIDRWVYLICSLAPLEISGPRWLLTSLSPIDYVCAAALLDLCWRQGVARLIQQVRTSFGSFALIVWAVFYLFGIIDAKLSGGNIRGLLRWGEFLFCFLLARCAVRERISAGRGLAALLTLCAAALSLSAIVQFIQSHGDYTRVFATFHQHNGFSAYLSLALPAAWGIVLTCTPPYRRWAIPAALLITTAFMLSYSRGAWLGLLIGLSLAAMLRLWNIRTSRGDGFLGILLVSFLGASVLVPLAVVRYHPMIGSMRWSPGLSTGARETTRGLWTTSERPYYWKAALTIIRKHPWLGMGPGRYDTVLPDYLEPDALRLYRYELIVKHHSDFWSHLHSMYLQMLIQYGWIGFVVWSVALCSLIVPRLRALIRDRSILSFCFFVSVVAFLVHNTVDILFVSSLDLLMVFILSISS